MSPIVVQLNLILAIGTVAMQVAAVAILILAVYECSTKRTTIIGGLVDRFAMLGVFLLSTVALVMSLVYSEVFGFIPCSWCWFQRIFSYPIVFISGLALFMKDKVFAPAYMLALSIPGAIIALYQHYLQMGGSELVACPATTVSCSQRFLFEFGYVTFPMLAFSLFALVIVIVLHRWVLERVKAGEPTLV